MMVLLIGVAMGCRHDRPIDEVFRWPSSGVPEADSLILEFERRSISIDTPVRSYRDIEIRMCSLAEKYPDNKLVQSRARYIQYINLDLTKISTDSLRRMIADEKNMLDSSQHSYDWHVWSISETDYDPDMVKKYITTTENIIFFKKSGALYEEGRALVQLGNLMKDYSDTAQAKGYYKQAEEIYNKLGQKKNVFICQLNLANTVPIDEQNRILTNLLNDTAARKLGRLQIWVMQNYFLSTEKVEYLDSALLIASNRSYFSDNSYIEEIPFLIALKGNYLDQSRLEHENGKNYILAAFDSIKNDTYPTHYIQMMHKVLGAAYGNMGKLDSATHYLYQSILWQDSLTRELQQTRVASLDAKNRIELAERNTRQQRDIWIWSLTAIIVVVISCVVILIINYKRRQAIKEYQQLLTEQKLQKSQESLKIQTMLIEENEKFIEEITGQINILRERGEIDMASVGAISRIMKIHKSDNDAHKGLLEVKNGVNDDFITKLKEDFPPLTEGQLKLAAMIAVGAESPQICRMLGIQLSSLHKSRYRLRTRLGLKNDDSLEEFLRNRNRSAV